MLSAARPLSFSAATPSFSAATPSLSAAHPRPCLPRPCLPRPCLPRRYDDGDEDDEDRLSPQDVEQLVERYLITRKRADELEGENAKLTQQLLELAHGQAPETLVVQVSPEMW